MLLDIRCQGYVADICCQTYIAYIRCQSYAASYTLPRIRCYACIRFKVFVANDIWRDINLRCQWYVAIRRHMPREPINKYPGMKFPRRHFTPHRLRRKSRRSLCASFRRDWAFSESFGQSLILSVCNWFIRALLTSIPLREISRIIEQRLRHCKHPTTARIQTNSIHSSTKAYQILHLSES